MNDDRDPPEIPLEPFPVHRQESPFPPLYDSLPPGPGDPYSDWNQSADAHGHGDQQLEDGEAVLRPRPTRRHQ